MAEEKRCTYCGTALDVHGREASSGGWQHHYMGRCREFVKAASVAKDEEIAALRARAERAEMALEKAIATGGCRGCVEDACDPGGAAPHTCGATDLVVGRLAIVEARAERYREALERARDALRSAAPHTWAVGTSFYESALVWEREACDAIAAAEAALAATGDEEGKGGEGG